MNVKWTLILAAGLFALNSTAGEKWNKEHKAHKEKAESGFMKAAREYDAKASYYEASAKKETDPAKKRTMLSLSDKYHSLADHKREAQNRQNKGKGYDWKDYYATQQEIGSMEKGLYKSKHADKYEKKTHSEKEVYKKHMNEKEGMKKESAPMYHKEKKTSWQQDKDADETAAPKPKAYKTKSNFVIRTSL